VVRGKADGAELPTTYGADMNARDADGTSALDLALERNKPALVELLQRAGFTP
jgi:ankyrin repeat protein